MSFEKKGARCNLEGECRMLPTHSERMKLHHRRAIGDAKLKYSWIFLKGAL
jgi:hypothetical protein